MAQLSIFRFYYVWSMLLREEHFNSNQEEYKEAFLLRVLIPMLTAYFMISKGNCPLDGALTGRPAAASTIEKYHDLLNYKCQDAEYRIMPVLILSLVLVNVLNSNLKRG